MPTSFEATAVLLVALVPGALYIWSFERMAGRWGIGLSDRIFRFVGASAIIHAVLAPMSYWLWTRRWPSISAGDSNPLWLWLVAVVYVAVPLGIGTLVGLATRSRSDWTRWITGPDPAPRAWDYLFQGERDGWVRIKLKTGPWIGGAYATYGDMKSYSAGYPEQQDVFLARSADLDPATGEFQFEPDGTVRLGAGGLLVRWEEIEYLEYIDA
jgi:hypothetical protein